MSWLTGSSFAKSQAKRDAKAAAAAQQAQLTAQNAQTAQAAQTLAALLGSQTTAQPPVINFPELPKVARAPSQVDPEVAAAQLRRSKRRTGGRTGSQSTGLVKRG